MENKILRKYDEIIDLNNTIDDLLKLMNEHFDATRSDNVVADRYSVTRYFYQYSRLLMVIIEKVSKQKDEINELWELIKDKGGYKSDLFKEE